MYDLVLALHALVRWVVILAGLAAALRGVAGWLGRKPWTPADDRAGRIVIISFDTQVLLGLLMYFFVSPTTTSAFRNMGGAMGNAVVRFWVVEHPAAMILGLALAHVGLARIRRAETAMLKHRRAAIFFGLALLLVALGSPWPWSAVARPLWPF